VPARGLPRRDGVGVELAPGNREDDAAGDVGASVGVDKMCMIAEGSIRSPLEPRCAGQPFVPSVARGVGSNVGGAGPGSVSGWAVGENVLGSARGSTCCDNGGRNPLPARRPGLPVSEARGVGSNAVTSSGSDGPPPCVLWVQFFASDAVGVGSNRTRSNSDGPPCLPAAEMPLEEPSCAVGVGSISASVLGGTGAGPGKYEHPLAPVCRADVGGANTCPERIKPCFGQVLKDDVEPTASPPERGDVFDDDQPRWAW